MNFVCPTCQSGRLEEIVVDVIQATEVEDVKDEDGCPSIEYGDHINDGGEVSRFQCFKCGEHIADNEDDLLVYLKERNML